MELLIWNIWFYKRRLQRNDIYTITNLKWNESSFFSILCIYFFFLKKNFFMQYSWIEKKRASSSSSHYDKEMNCSIFVHKIWATVFFHCWWRRSWWVNEQWFMIPNSQQTLNDSLLYKYMYTWRTLSDLIFWPKKNYTSFNFIITREREREGEWEIWSNRV